MATFMKDGEEVCASCGAQKNSGYKNPGCVYGEECEGLAPAQNITRFEVIDHRKNAPDFGRFFTARGCKVELSMQDGNRTLKVFLSDE